MNINNKKIAFIYCVTNELYYSESCYYLNKLMIPDGYEMEIIAVKNARSMCAGYQEAMESSDAKYKVYLHQDVFVRDKDFIVHLLELFTSDSHIGMVGMIGGTQMSKSGVAFRDWNVGMVDWREPDMAYILQCEEERITSNMKVEAIDGLLIATQYDLPWREDLFQEFDFYDVSQSFEFRKAGYEIVVPYQREPWVIHDSSFAKLKNYEKNRRICLREYPEFFYAEDGFEPEYHDEWEQLSEQLVQEIKGYINSGNWQIVGEILSAYKKLSFKNTELERMLILYEIYYKDAKNGRSCFFLQYSEYEQMEEMYLVIRLLLRRMELFDDEEEYSELIELLQSGALSIDAIVTMVVHSSIEKKRVLHKLKKYIKTSQNELTKLDQVIRCIPDALPIVCSQIVKKRKC